MPRHYPAFLAAAAVIALYGCGNVGEPLYPSLNIPVRITDLRVVQHAGTLLIDFTIPAITTDGVVVKKIGSVDLEVGGKQEPVRQTAPGPAHTELPVTGFVGKDLMVRVRLVNFKGHASDWSNEVTLAVVAPVAPPSGVTAASDPSGVKVSWTASGATHFRVYRRSPTDKEPVLAGESDAPEYIDKTAEFGKTYVYSVQAVNGTAQSEVATAEPVTPKDIFPPGVPSGVTVSPGVNTVELAWERNTEPDFKGYRVYRSIDNGPFERVADMIEAPSFSDKNIQGGRHYRYTVSAVDQAGNESKPSEPVEITP